MINDFNDAMKRGVRVLTDGMARAGDISKQGKLVSPEPDDDLRLIVLIDGKYHKVYYLDLYNLPEDTPAPPTYTIAFNVYRYATSPDSEEIYAYALIDSQERFEPQHSIWRDGAIIDRQVITVDGDGKLLEYNGEPVFTESEMSKRLDEDSKVHRQSIDSRLDKLRAAADVDVRIMSLGSGKYILALEVPKDRILRYWNHSYQDWCLYTSCLGSNEWCTPGNNDERFIFSTYDAAIEELEAALAALNKRKG